jgi:hypothetical protein
VGVSQTIKQSMFPHSDLPLIPQGRELICIIFLVIRPNLGYAKRRNRKTNKRSRVVNFFGVLNRFEEEAFGAGEGNGYCMLNA